MKKRLIFVVGNSRSGTTMMGRILGRHKTIFTFHEIHFFEQLVSAENLNKVISVSEANKLLSTLFSIQREGYLNKRRPEKFKLEAKEKLSIWRNEVELTPLNIFKEYLIYESNNQNKGIPCDQTPRNLFFIEEILEYYPKAKIVNMIRDPRDVLLSQKKKWKRKFLGGESIPIREALRSWANYHPYVISKLWNSSIKAGDIAAEEERKVLNVYFEELLENPEDTIQNVCQYIGIDYTSEMLEVPQVGSSSAKDQPNKKGINSSRASSWQKGGLTKAELFICQKVCAHNMKKHGYRIDPSDPSFIGITRACLLLPLKLFVSFLMNMKRYKNIIESIKRRFA